jgi:hypothetical protein
MSPELQFFRRAKTYAESLDVSDDIPPVGSKAARQLEHSQLTR